VVVSPRGIPGSLSTWLKKTYISMKDPSSLRPCEGCLPLHCHELGVQFFGWRSYALFARSNNLEVVSDAWLLLCL
jgi:hypothetical protein